MYKQDNKDTIILLKPESGKIVEDDNLIEFLPIIKRNLPIEYKNIIEKITVKDNKIVFEGIGNKDIIKKIVDYLRNNISEKLIVEQLFQTGPEVRHRPLFFGLGDDDKSIIMKYYQLGKFNSLDVAFKQANEIC